MSLACGTGGRGDGAGGGDGVASGGDEHFGDGRVDEGDSCHALVSWERLWVQCKVDEPKSEGEGV